MILLLERAGRAEEELRNSSASGVASGYRRDGIAIIGIVTAFNSGYDFEVFERFAEEIRALPDAGPSDIELERFSLYQDERTRICYAPFDHVNTVAKVIVLGITPGRNSTVNAFRAATAALRAGETHEKALRAAKEAGSFSNMRSRIAEMLDGIGLHTALAVASCGEIFSSRYDLLHPTSVMRYPVFTWNRSKKTWINYTGYSPRLHEWEQARTYIESLLKSELQQLDAALIVPCGEAVTAVLRCMCQKCWIDDRRCLFGFPHASGANGHMQEFYQARKRDLAAKVAAWAGNQ